MKTLLAVAAAACLLVGCGKTGPSLNMDVYQEEGKPHGIVFDYMMQTKVPIRGNRELVFFDFGFNGTLDSVVDYVPKKGKKVISKNSSDFNTYDSLYYQVRDMANMGRVWELK